MKRSITITEDGSSTLYAEAFGEHYHSSHGALTESQMIFIEAGFNQCRKNRIQVLEMGFGSGLNALLTLKAAISAGKEVYYHGIEKYPISMEEAQQLNFVKLDEGGLPEQFLYMHEMKWNRSAQVSPGFTLCKELQDITDFQPEDTYDVIYFDAFSPVVQPELWRSEIFQKLFCCTAPGGILTTYSSKGIVRRTLKEAGFSVEKLPGPPGKREFVRAIKAVE